MRSWTPYVAVWSLFALIVLVLAIYRKMLSNREDDTIHISLGTQGMIPEQIVNSHRIDVVEKWGKSLTIVVVIAGLAMASLYLYGVWVTGPLPAQ
jgi:hypothetical protein